MNYELTNIWTKDGKSFVMEGMNVIAGDGSIHRAEPAILTELGYAQKVIHWYSQDDEKPTDGFAEIDGHRYWVRNLLKTIEDEEGYNA